MKEPKQELKLEKAVFAAGCFWGVEEAFRVLKGVVSTRVGYTGGDFKDPTYQDVCSRKTGHAEAVEVTFDPSRISYEQLLEVFWKIHSPVQSGGLPPELRSQYRSAIFFFSSGQEKSARESKSRFERSSGLKGKVTTEIVPAGEFCQAEEYHQKYLQKRGQGACGLK